MRMQLFLAIRAKVSDVCTTLCAAEATQVSLQQDNCPTRLQQGNAATLHVVLSLANQVILQQGSRPTWLQQGNADMLHDVLSLANAAAPQQGTATWAAHLSPAVPQALPITVPTAATETAGLHPVHEFVMQPICCETGQQVSQVGALCMPAGFTLPGSTAPNSRACSAAPVSKHRTPTKTELLCMCRHRLDSSS